MACLWHTQEHGVPIQLERTKKGKKRKHRATMSTNQSQTRPITSRQPGQRGEQAGNTLLAAAGANNTPATLSLTCQRLVACLLGWLVACLVGWLLGWPAGSMLTQATSKTASRWPLN